MSSFRPGVREVNVETIDAVVGDRFGEELGGICPDYPYVRQAPSADAVYGVSVVFPGSLYCEEVEVRPGTGLVKDEGALAAANFDVKGGATSENLHDIDLPV